MVPGCRETHSWLRVELVNAQFRLKPTISCLFRRFSATIIGKTRLAFWGMGGVDFLIRKRFNFPEPFRLVRKTLFISFPEYERIWSDRSRVMSRDVPKTLLLVQILEVDFLVACWMFDYL